MDDILQHSFAVFFVFCIVFAMISDYQRLRIPNMVSIALVIGFIPYALSGGVADIWMHVLLAAAVLIVMFIFFALNWMGAGDVKLAAAIMLWVGPAHGSAFFIMLAVFGGIFALGLLVLRRALLYHPRLAEMPVLRKFSRWAHKGVFPYGLPIGAAALCIAPSIFNI